MNLVASDPWVLDSSSAVKENCQEIAEKQKLVQQRLQTGWHK